MKTLILLLVLLFYPTHLHAAPGLAPQMEKLLREQGLAGAVWTTLDAHGAAGLKDARSGTPMRVDQRVQVGSVAKTVLALGILRLVSQGRLALDAPVSTVLPKLIFDNPWHASDPVRIRHLLDHSAGLDDARFWQVFSMRAHADAPLAAAFPARDLLRVRHLPGTRFSYSNMGYTVLGMVIERVTGQPYERYLDTALLAPLGMHDSTSAFVTQARDARLATGHFEDGGGHPAMPSTLRPAAQFTTTAADMARLARFLMGDGRIHGQPFIDAALLRQMGQPHGTEAARAGLQAGYGLGLRTVDRHGALARCHGGNTIGFRAMLCLFPDTRQAFFIAINTDSETADYHRFDALFIAALKPAVTRPPALPSRPFAPQAWKGLYIPAPNRFDSLRLVDTVANFMVVSASGATLRLKPFQSAEVELRHVGHGLFQAPAKLLASHAMLVTPQGQRVITTGTQSYERVPLMRLLPLWTSIGAGLLGLGCIVIMGAARLAMRRLAPHDALLPPFAGVLALPLPLPFFYGQSFVALGDLTLASGLLALLTAALPMAMLAGLGMAWRRRSIGRVESAAMLAVLQCCLVLATWELLPLRLWA